MADQNNESGESSGNPGHESASDEEAADWFAVSAIRATLALFGLLLLLLALGQVVGVNLLEMVAEVLDTHVGRWLTVAFFALILIVVALRGFEMSSD